MMSLQSSICIKAPEEKDIAAIVDIHRSMLGYTLNSQMGKTHLSAMYQAMLESPNCCVLVAFDGQTPIGLVSGAVDLYRARSEILRRFTLPNWLNMLFRLILNPFMIHEWLKGFIIGKPVYDSGVIIPAILTTIAVKKEYQKLGVGEQLVRSLDEYFLRQNINLYRLDTLISNIGSRSFYQKLGFVEVESRADSVVLVKRIATL